jgi:CubicO group peptidase (beta-lactamase class C family)
MKRIVPAPYHLLTALLLVWGALGCGSQPAKQKPANASQESANPANDQAAAPKPFAGVHDYLQGLVDERKIAGAVALVTKDGEVVYSDAVGHRNVEAAAPMTEDTIFRIMSMTKPITSVGALILVDEGLISLDDPVAKYIPAFARVQVAVQGPSGKYRNVKAERKVTIRDLLTHTSGLTYTFVASEHIAALYKKAGVSDGLRETPGTMADNVAKLVKLPLTSQPGKAFNYGLSTDVLGHVIEKVSGKTLSEFLEERIFTPLDMKDTGFRVAEEDEDRLAAVYQPKADDKTVEPLPEGGVENGNLAYSATYPLARESKYYSGGAGLVSTARDYARFAQMLLDGGKLGDVQILKPETAAMMVENQIGDLTLGMPGSDDKFGLGVGVTTEAVAGATDPAPGSPGSFTWGGFYNTLFWVDPEQKLVAVMMTQIFPWDHLAMWPAFRAHVYEALSAE